MDIKPVVEVPASTLHATLSFLLESGNNSDVTFLVEGEPIKAHSQILCVRSEFFDKELTCGFRESVSKEVVVNDCDSNTFKILLKYLYTDDLCCIDDAIRMSTSSINASPTDGSNSTDTNKDNSRIALLQRLLAASHKYQASRLQCWCELQLGEHISVKEVCSVLCQAHLYEAKQLEKVCLAFIKEHMDTIVTTHTFGSLIQDWPEVMLKISIYTAGVSESSATQAINGQQESRLKRQLQASVQDEDARIKRQRTD
jgi:speckle-type POZ protein